MGWSYGWYSRKQLIEYLTKGWESNGIVHRCLKAVPKGNIIWMVWEHQAPGREPERDIQCALLTRAEGDSWECRAVWGEDCGPVYYTCPISFFKDVPEPPNQYARDWRAEILKNRGKLQGFKVGGIVKLTDGCKPIQFVTVTRTFPLKFAGYRVRRRLIDRAVPELDELIAKLNVEFGGQGFANSWHDDTPDQESGERMIAFAKANPFPKGLERALEEFHFSQVLKGTWLGETNNEIARINAG